MGIIRSDQKLKDLQKGYAAMEAHDQQYSEAMEKYRSEYERSLNMFSGGGGLTASAAHGLANSQIGTITANSPNQYVTTTPTNIPTTRNYMSFTANKIENGWILHDNNAGKQYYCETREDVGTTVTTLITFLEN